MRRRDVITFQIRLHDTRSGVEVVEILLDGQMVATIYPCGDKSVRLVSAHFGEVKQDDGSTSVLPIPLILISFDPQPYTIEGGRLVKFPKK